MAADDRTHEADLVIVSSPLQYINAVEQRASVGDRPADLVLIGDRHGAGEAIERLIARRAPWRSVVRHGRRPRPPRFTPLFVRDLLDAAHRASLERLARRLTGARRTVVFGDYRNVSQRLLVARLAHEELVLLDDGAVAPQAAAFRRDPNLAAAPGQFDLAWFRTALARRAFGDPVLPEPKRVVFFTIYDAMFAGRLAPGDGAAPNRYESWRAIVPTRPRGAGVWLIGSDHAEGGITTVEAYRTVVLGAVKTLRDEGRGPITYRPHRGEDRAKAAALAAAGGMSLSGSTTPVELDYLDAAQRPAMVVVIASSAADTLATLDPALEIARVAFPGDYLVRRADHIRAVVAAHDAFNPRLRVINLGSGG